MAGIEIIDTLSDMGDTVKDIVGEKGLTLLIIGGIGFLAYSAIKKNGTLSAQNDGDDERSVVAIASYPDVGENANVVIDTLQDSILYSEMNMTDVMGTNFEATNNYINDASNSIKGKIDDQSEMIESNFNKTFTDLASIYDVAWQTSKNVVRQAEGKKMGKMETGRNLLGTKATTTTKGTTTQETNYTGVSLVNALKSIGINQYDGYNIGDYRSRINIAKANGIDNYTGTAEQNNALLEKIRNGNFVLPA